MINHFVNNNILEYSLYCYQAGQDNYMNLRYSYTLVIIIIGCDPSHSFFEPLLIMICWTMYEDPSIDLIRVIQAAFLASSKHLLRLHLTKFNMLICSVALVVMELMWGTMKKFYARLHQDSA